MPIVRWDPVAESYVDLRTGSPVFTPFVENQTEPVAENTGYRVPLGSLAAASGVLTLSTSQTYSRKHLTGRIIVPQSVAPDAFGQRYITIEDNFVDASGLTLTSQKAVIEVHPKTNAKVIVRFNELKGQKGMLGIATMRFDAYRNDIHHVEDACRMNTFNADTVVLDAKFRMNYCHDLIMVTPDPYNTRSDLKTHSDVVQIEGGTGAVVTGNALHGYNSTDGTSNVGWVENTGLYRPVANGTANASDHPQSLSCVMITPDTAPVLNFDVSYNWMPGGEVGVNAGSSGNSNSTGTFYGNRFYKTGRWQNRPPIIIDISDQTAPFRMLTSGNVYIEDGSSAEGDIRRNW